MKLPLHSRKEISMKNILPQQKRDISEFLWTNKFAIASGAAVVGGDYRHMGQYRKKSRTTIQKGDDNRSSRTTRNCKKSCGQTIVVAEMRYGVTWLPRPTIQPRAINANGTETRYQEFSGTHDVRWEYYRGEGSFGWGKKRNRKVELEPSFEE